MYINNLNLEKGGPPVTALALILSYKWALSFLGGQSIGVIAWPRLP